MGERDRIGFQQRPDKDADGAVHNHVEPIDHFGGYRHQFACALDGADVAPDRMGACPERAKRLDGGIRRVLVAKIVYQNVPARFGEPLRDREADALASSRDQDGHCALCLGLAAPAKLSARVTPVDSV